MKHSILTIRAALVHTLALAAFVVPAVVLAAPQTLVVRGEEGNFGPGAAASWTVGENEVTFVLVEGVDPAAFQKLLEERLFNAKVSVDGNQVKVTGIPAQALLEQVSGLGLDGEADPLADLAGLGAVVAMQTPEGGGSIRASKPMASALPDDVGGHDPGERVLADVLSVTRGDFPMVTLKVKLRSSARKGEHKKKLRAGRVVEGGVVFVSRDGKVDFGNAATQRNLAAWYLARGDRITVHALPTEKKGYELDFIERAKR